MYVRSNGGTGGSFGVLYLLIFRILGGGGDGIVLRVVFGVLYLALG